MTAEPLPETAAVYWRPRVDAHSLARRGRVWTLTTVAHTVPYVAATGVLFALEPLSAPVGAILLAHAWAIPELYAKRGANVLRARPRAGDDCGADRSGAARRPRRPRGDESCTPAPASCSSAARSASGSWGRPVRCS